MLFAVKAQEQEMGLKIYSVIFHSRTQVFVQMKFMSHLGPDAALVPFGSHAKWNLTLINLTVSVSTGNVLSWKMYWDC